MLSTVQIYSLICVTLCAIVIIILERVFPYNKNQRILREGFLDDFLLYNVIQTLMIGFVISVFIDFINNTTGISRLKLITNWPLLLQLAFFTVTHDLYIYFFHKWQHKNKFLWRLHEAHHSTKEVDWLSGVRSHALEILINQTIEFLPIVLLGAAPQVAVIKGAISAVWGMYIHSNIRVNSGWLQYIINGPEMHRWHHSQGKGRNKNFSTKLAIWDWIFGTDYLPQNELANQYGLKTYFPSGYLKQFLYAFRTFNRG
ncbi:MAG: sterol desaturase family protein [Ignavibacteriaceae bacterium]|nr:sterol desaturase family protein [Ignavibacteriaceae bacterium]